MAQPVAPPSRAGDAERRSVGILLFEDVEVLDFAGPYEVFSRTRLEPGPVAARGGSRVIPDYSFGDVPEIDILVVPGGFGTRSMPSARSTRPSRWRAARVWWRMVS